jgi:uncharacterized membrane protein YadS
MAKVSSFNNEDAWAIYLGLFLILLTLVLFYAGASIAPFAPVPSTWHTASELLAHFQKNIAGYVAVIFGFGLLFGLGATLMGHPLGSFIKGYALLSLSALIIFCLAGFAPMKELDIGPSLLALVLGLMAGNILKIPEFMRTALRTEYYIKTGIVLLGATLPLTLIATAGPLAFLQATIVSVTTFLTIYFSATRLFGLEPKFGAVLGTGGAVCGVSGSIAIGGAVRAHKDHIAIGIAVVSIWAIVMIFVLAFLTKLMVRQEPGDGLFELSPAQAGAWVGTSEYADAAGYAVVAELSKDFGEPPIHAFTLMKVIGRDIWIGIWAFVLSLISVIFWEKGDAKASRVSARVIWDRFPKFVLGFVIASILVSFLAKLAPSDHVAKVELHDKFKEANFETYACPDTLKDRFQVAHDGKSVIFKGQMTDEDLALLLSTTQNPAQKSAIMELKKKSNWFESEFKPKVIDPIKKLREWAFVFCFLSIGLATRIKDLLTFGLKPFWAFTIGVLVNCPLGFLLTSKVFGAYWRALG